MRRFARSKGKSLRHRRDVDLLSLAIALYALPSCRDRSVPERLVRDDDRKESRDAAMWDAAPALPDGGTSDADVVDDAGDTAPDGGASDADVVDAASPFRVGQKWSGTLCGSPALHPTIVVERVDGIVVGARTDGVLGCTVGGPTLLTGRFDPATGRAEFRTTGRPQESLGNPVFNLAGSVAALSGVYSGTVEASGCNEVGAHEGREGQVRAWTAAHGEDRSFELVEDRVPLPPSPRGVAASRLWSTEMETGATRSS
jgi:hypothetical protein